MPKQKVAYFYDPEIGSYYYGPGHPMKPHRLRMTQSLVLHYGLFNMMENYLPRPAEGESMAAFHDSNYVAFLRIISPDNMEHLKEQRKKFNVGEDCPVFQGMYPYCQSYVGASLGGAVKLNYNSADIVINWSGGLHHAKKAEASGFCYVNDIVLACLELLKYHQRVLYVDVDVHHGDGVEEAFLTTDRVMTVSFHQYGDEFFPGTGSLDSTGAGQGKGYSVNVPLKQGISDAAYSTIFKPIMTKVIEKYCPEVIVYQSGADSLTGDRLGKFNLSTAGHAECLKFVQGFNLPMLVLGGGGYRVKNVARCWAFETGTLLGVDMEDGLPDNEYREYFAPDYKLQLHPDPQVPDQNERRYLDDVVREVLSQLQGLASAPSVAFHERVPSGPMPASMPNPAVSDLFAGGPNPGGISDFAHTANQGQGQALQAQIQESQGLGGPRGSESGPEGPAGSSGRQAHIPASHWAARDAVAHLHAVLLLPPSDPSNPGRSPSSLAAMRPYEASPGAVKRDLESLPGGPPHPLYPRELPANPPPAQNGYHSHSQTPPPDAGSVAPQPPGAGQLHAAAQRPAAAGLHRLATSQDAAHRPPSLPPPNGT